MDIFDNNETIITNENLFSDFYIPEKLPSREKEITEIAKVLKSVLNFQKSMNVALTGRPGTGKTIVSRYILYKLKEKNKDIKTIYISCNETMTFNSLLWNIIKNLSPEEKYSRFEDPRSKIDKLVNPMTVVVLDDLQKIVSRKELNSIIFWSSRTFSNIVFIYIYSSDITHKLDPDTLSSFKSSTKIIYFKSYSTEDLFKILKFRTEKGLKKGAITEGQLRKIAAYVAKESGDAREAIGILRLAAEISEQEGSDVVKDSHIEKAIDSYVFGEWISKISTLSPTLKDILLSYFLLFMDGRRVITPSDAYIKYKEISVKPVSYFWFSKYTTYLISEEFLKIEKTEKRKRYLTINVPEDVVKRVIEEM